MTVELSPRDLATVLATLRMWQSLLIRGEAPTDSDHFDEDAPLDVDEIEELCERINCGA
jgi:hypothetical protein